MRLLALLCLMLSLAAATAAGDRAPRRPPQLPAALPLHPGTASLPRFTLIGWVSPPADSTTPARYAELADAGLNVTVLAWEDPGLVPPNLLRLECTAPVGVKNLLLDNRLDLVHENDPATFATLDSIVAAYRDHPAFLGYYLGDEPRENMFPRIAEWFRLLRARDPAHPAWNNLLGRGVYPTRDAFLAYLREYASVVQPAMLSTDHYDHLETSERGLFVDNVSATAQVAREYGLPFMGFVLVTQHTPFREVDDGLLSWQVAQYLSYGARGVGYFTYWTPAPDPAMNWRDGMIRYGTGERSPHYEQVRVLNQLVKPVGECLADLAWLGTEHAGGTPVGGTTFMPDSLVAAVEGRASLGQFADSQGTPHLFVANRDSAAARTIALELVGERRVERMGEGGAWSEWTSLPTATGRRVELPLAPGGFALLRLSGGCVAVVNGGCTARFSAAPEPAHRAVRFAAERVSGASTLMIVDASGRRVWGRTLTGEAPVVVWDGRTDDGTRVRPGLYWARLEDSRGSVVRKVTWLGH